MTGNGPERAGYEAVIFDLGNTLVAYYTREQWPAIWRQAIDNVAACLDSLGMLRVPLDDLPARVEAVTHERKDHRVVPMAERLARIFKLTPDDLADGREEQLCRRFLAPAFAAARRYEDSLPTLAKLRDMGLKTGILSNLPWGSPAALWREELARHGLLEAVDAFAFCVEAGFRKPAPQPFELIMSRLGVTPEQCLFVGDDPRWDIAGPKQIGMDAILIDRTGEHSAADGDVIDSLHQLIARLHRT